MPTIRIALANTRFPSTREESLEIVLEAMKEAYSVYRVSGDKGKAWGWIQGINWKGSRLGSFATSWCIN